MVQVMQPEEADPEKLGFDPFDVTKVWPRVQFPMKEFGRLVLNKNPENFHRNVEQAAFSPGSLVPGIEDSPDPLLQFRMFFYRDAQFHRIGVNLHQVPVNCPFMAQSYSPLTFDGQMRVDANHAGNKQYVPNSFAHKFRPDVAEAPYVVSDNIVSRKSHYWHEGKKNEYDQTKELWSRVMSKTQRTLSATQPRCCDSSSIPMSRRSISPRSTTLAPTMPKASTQLCRRRISILSRSRRCLARRMSGTRRESLGRAVESA